MHGVPEHFAAYVVGTGFLLAVIVVAIGATRLVQTSLAFKKRLNAYKTLPFAAALEHTQAKTAMLSSSLELAPRYVERAQRAIADIASARASSIDSARRAVDYVRDFFTRR